MTKLFNQTQLINTVFFILFCLGFLTACSNHDSTSPHIGLIQEELKPCLENTLCLRGEDLPYQEDQLSAQAKIMKVINALEGDKAQLISQKNNYLHFEIKSSLFNQIDDVEFLFKLKNDKNVIEMKSAARPSSFQLLDIFRNQDSLQQRLHKIHFEFVQM